MTMPMTRQLTARTAALIARLRAAASCAVSSGIHRSPVSESGIGSTILGWPERLFDALNDRIEQRLPGEGIDQGEAADHTTAAAEHDLLVEHAFAVLSRQHKPALPARRVV